MCVVMSVTFCSIERKVGNFVPSDIRVVFRASQQKIITTKAEGFLI